jgi:hypothetical protein
MVHALRGMSLPPSIMGMRRASPESRRYVGNPAAAALVALGPIALAAAGITFIVVATVYVVTEADAEKERCKKVKEACIEHCTKWGLPAPGGGRFRSCMRECMEREGCSF